MAQNGLKDIFMLKQPWLVLLLLICYMKFDLVVEIWYIFIISKEVKCHKINSKTPAQNEICSLYSKYIYNNLPYIVLVYLT